MPSLRSALHRLRGRMRAVFLRRAPRWFARVCVPDARELGELGEELAVRALLRAGLVIEGRRIRTPFAEVDVLARDVRALAAPASTGGHAEIVLVEVKTMRVELVPGPRGALRDPSRAVFRAGGRLESGQLRRLQKAAEWLAKKRRARVRVDVVEVRVCARKRSVEIDHRSVSPAAFGAASGWNDRR